MTKQSRLARKAARSNQSQSDRDYNAIANELRHRRDEALAGINEQFRQGVEKLETQRKELRAAVWAQYDAERETQIASAAKAEAQAA